MTSTSRNRWLDSINHLQLVLLLYFISNSQTWATSSSQDSPGVSFVFDPRVSAKCERNLMHISVSNDQPFNGIIHVRNYRRNPCQTYGNGSLVTTLTIDLLAQTNRPNYCGVHRNKGSEERSISLVVRLHRALELSDDKHFVITCGNTEFFNRNKNEKLMFKFVDGNGHRIVKLYHGEPYRLRAEIISSQEQPLLSTAAIGGPSKAKSNSYHLYVRNCFIFNGNESDIEFLNEQGCPTIGTVGAFKQIGHNIAEAEIGSMFKLPGTNQIHLQCMVELVDNCEFCQSTLCGGSNETSGKTSKVDMQMLASTTAYVFEPDQQQLSASILNGNCTEWRFPWLIALCIMLGVLLIIMMVVNIFLCTSMNCSCFKSEVVEHEPTIIEDYDPYKIDIGFYSPYDSRLSLNRNYTAYSDSDHAYGPQSTQQHPILLNSYSPVDPRLQPSTRAKVRQQQPHQPAADNSPRSSSRSQEFY